MSNLFWLPFVSLCILLPRDSFCSFLLFFRHIFSQLEVEPVGVSWVLFRIPRAQCMEGAREVLLEPVGYVCCLCGPPPPTSQSPYPCDTIVAPSPLPGPTAQGWPQPRLATLRVLNFCEPSGD